MSDYTSNTTVNVWVNGERAKETLADLRKRAAELQKEIAQVKAAGDKVDKVKLEELNKEFNDVDRRIKQIMSSTAQAENVLKRLDKATPNELKKTLRTLTRQLNNIERGSAAWNEHTAKIRMVKDELARVNGEMMKSTTWLERFNMKFEQWKNVGAGFIAAATGAVIAGKKAVNAYAEMQQEEANVRKYTGMTEEQVNNLNDAFKQMDTRSSRENLNKLAQDAGRLGKQSEEDVLGFVRAADKINVALDDLGDGATLTLSKLTTIFGDEERLGTEKALLSVGSVINELSQNCTASAPYLAEFGQRLAGVGAQAHMTIPEIMGFGAVLDAQGQKVEMSSTALSNVIMSLFKKPEKIAKATGMAVEEFAETCRRSTNEGLLMLLDRLHELGGIDSLAPVFAEMGENGARASAVLAALAGNVDMVRQQQEAANVAFEEAISIDKEFEVQNTTVQASLEKSRNRFNEMAVALGKELMPVMRHFISGTSMAMRIMLKTIEFVKEHKTAILATAAAIVGYTLAVRGAMIVQKAWSLVVAVATRGQAALQAATILLRAAFYTMTGQINRAKNAMIAFNMLSKANPWGLLTAAIFAAGTALVMYIKRQREASAVEKEMKSVQDSINKQYAEQKGKIDMLVAAVNDEKKSLNERRKALEELRKIVPGYHAELTNEGKLINNNKEAVEKYIEALNKEIALKAYQEKLEEAYRKKAELEMLKDEQSKTQEQAQSEYDKAQKGYVVSRSGALVSTAGLEESKLNAANAELEKTNKELTQANEVITAINKKVEQYAQGMQKVREETEEVEEETPVVVPTPEDDTKSKNKFQAEDDWREKEQAKERIFYAQGLNDYETYTKNMLQIEVDYIRQKLQHTDLEGNEKITLEAAYYEALKKQQERYIKGSAEEENEAYQQLMITLKQKYADGEMTARQYENATEMAELQHLQNLVNIYEEGSKERLKAQRDYERASLKYQEQHIKEAKRIQEQLQSQFFSKSSQVANPEEYQRDLGNLEIVYTQMLKAAGDNAKDRLNVERAFHEAKYQLARKYNMKEAADQENAFRNAIDNSVDWLNSDGGKAMTGTMDLIVGQMSQIFSALSDVVQAELDIQTAQIEKKYEKEVSLAEGNKYKETQLEKQKQKEIAKAKNEANRKMFAMQVIQAVAQTATAALAAYSSTVAIPLVGPALAPIAAAMAVAAGALQIAAIKKQQQAAESTGYMEGGFTRKGRRDEVAGVVHAGEWVASQALVNSPEARPLINALDYAQRTNSIANLRAEDVSRTISAPAIIAERLSAPSTGGNAVIRQTVSAGTTPNDKGLGDTLARLAQRLDEPFVTVNTVTGDKGIKRAQDDYEKLIRNKTPKSRR